MSAGGSRREEGPSIKAKSKASSLADVTMDQIWLLLKNRDADSALISLGCVLHRAAAFKSWLDLFFQSQGSGRAVAMLGLGITFSLC